KLRVAALGQHDAYGSKQIALALLRGKALAFEAEGAPRTGAGRNGELDRALKRRHAHLGAEYRLVERDRKLESQVGPGAGKQRVRRDRDGDQKVAGAAAGAGDPLPFQTDGLAVVQPGRNLHLNLPAGRQLHALVRALGRFRQRDRQRSSDVPAATAEIVLLELEAAWPPRTRRATERFLQNILKSGEPPEPARSSTAAARVLKTIGPPTEGFENILGPEATLPSARAETRTGLEPRFA